MIVPLVSIERIKQDLLDLSKIGKNPRDRGIYRMAFSEADLAGKDWLEKRMEQAMSEVEELLVRSNKSTVLPGLSQD